MTAASLHERFRKAPLSGAVEGAYRSRTGGGFRNEPLDQAAEKRAARRAAAKADNAPLEGIA